MKRYGVSLLTVFFLCMTTAAFAKDVGKIGMVNMQVFQENSKTFQAVRLALKKKFEALQQKLDKEKADLAKTEDEFKKQGMMLSLDAREDKQKELDKKRRYYKYLYDEYTQEMKEAELDARNKVSRDVQKIVSAMGAKEGYVLILERQMPGLIYFNKQIDITDKVIEAYDKAHQQ
jgi:outer membrane protein